MVRTHFLHLVQHKYKRLCFKKLFAYSLKLKTPMAPKGVNNRESFTNVQGT